MIRLPMTESLDVKARVNAVKFCAQGSQRSPAYLSEGSFGKEVGVDSSGLLCYLETFNKKNLSILQTPRARFLGDDPGTAILVANAAGRRDKTAVSSIVSGRS